MKKWKVGIIKEGKIPPDKRVPLTPKQCKQVMAKFPNVEIVVQPSDIRAFHDEEYVAQGIVMQKDLSDCDLIMGVKEVQIEDLIPEKKFMFFSHTIKKQSYNRALLRRILNLKIELIDYELIKDENGKRLIGFGRYAGIVGCYNSFLAYGKKTGSYELKRANQCADRKELEAELSKVVLPKDFKLVITGFGRVGHGAREILDLLPIKEITPEEYFSNHDGPVYAQLETEDYFKRKSDGGFTKSEFYSTPEIYVSKFNEFAEVSDMYISCHFWSNKSPKIITKEELVNNKTLKVVGDISCDINDPIGCTIRSSKVSDPIYGYDKQTKEESDFMDQNAIAVMAIDNLPCELPKDASEDFGNELIKNVFPYLFGKDKQGVIKNATETNKDGELNEKYQYLKDFVENK